MKLIFRTLLYVIGVAFGSSLIVLLNILRKHKAYTFETQDFITIGLLLFFTACVFYLYEKRHEKKQDQKDKLNIYFFLGLLVNILPNSFLSKDSIFDDFFVTLIELAILMLLLIIIRFMYKKCKILLQKIIRKYFHREEVK